MNNMVNANATEVVYIRNILANIFGECFEPEEITDPEGAAIAVAEALDSLGSKWEKLSVHYCAGLQYGYSEAARKMNKELGRNSRLSADKVCEICYKGLRRLRHPSRSAALRKYLPGRN